MSTNKELFEQQMNTLADTINNKTGMVGKKTIDEMLTTAEDNIVNFDHLYVKNIDGDNYLVNPTTLEPYFVYTDPTELTFEKFLEIAAQICADYNGSFVLCNGAPYEDGYILFNNLKTIYSEAEVGEIGTINLITSEFNTLRFYHEAFSGLSDFKCEAYNGDNTRLNISKQEEQEEHE